MTTEERQKVFQAFTRLKSAQGIEGTGLGLNITQELVESASGHPASGIRQGQGQHLHPSPFRLPSGTAPAAEEAEEQKPLAPVKPHFRKSQDTAAR